MSNRQCCCTDCAVSDDVITKVDGEYTAVMVDEDGTIFDPEYDDMSEAVGDLAEGFMCGECNDVHSDTYEAENCCSKWECNYCGWQHSKQYYSSARENAAQCCVTSCDDCSAVGWPDFIAGHTCNSGHGMRRQLPWEARGVVVDGRYPDDDTRWKSTWAIEPEQHNVVRAAADYYLLEAIKSGLVGTVDADRDRIYSEEKGEWVELPKPNANVANHTLMRILRNEADEMFAALVDKWDPILIAYTHMAVGGELRHHQSVGGEVLDSNRDRAWSGWKTIFEAVGTDALTDAAELFHEFEGGSFGGKPWADACLILHKRLTGQISRSLFLDRIFNAQHNGGCLLNKVRWAGDQARYGMTGTNPADAMSVEEMTYKVLPAHGTDGEPDYPVLLAYASNEVRALFTDCFEMGRRARLDMGMTLVGLPTKPAAGQTQFAERAASLAKAEAKKAWEAAQPKSYKYKKQARYYAKSAAEYKQYARNEQKSSKEAIIEAVTIALCGGKPMPACGVPGCYNCYVDFNGQYTYYMNTAKSYQSEADLQMAKYEAALHEELLAGITASAVIPPSGPSITWDPIDIDYDGEGDYDDYDPDYCECCS